MTKNASEEYVHELCTKSFFSLWSIPNPKGKDHQELCDLLLVCGSNIVIISVKHIEYKADEGDASVQRERWQRKAIESSVKQIRGAERRLGFMDTIESTECNWSLNLPPSEQRRLHRIAVAIGAENHLTVTSYGSGSDEFVHVFDADSLRIIVSELDTISDFVDYLDQRSKVTASIGPTDEENLLGIYINTEHSLPDYLFREDALLLFTGEAWDEFTLSRKYREYKDTYRISYLWDELIRSFWDKYRTGDILNPSSFDSYEQALRVMVEEDRYDRLLICEALDSFLKQPAGMPGRSKARVCKSGRHEDLVYLFVRFASDTPLDNRADELKGRAIVLRCLHIDKPRMVAISFVEADSCGNSQYDLMYVDIPEINQAMKDAALEIQNETGFFKNAKRNDS